MIGYESTRTTSDWIFAMAEQTTPTLFERMHLDISEVLDCMPGGFFVYHAQGDESLVYVNDACLRMFGCATLQEFKELTGFTFPGMVHPEDIDSVERSITRQIAASTYDMDYVEYRIVRRDGCVRWIEDYGHFVSSDEGDFFYVFVNDATEKKQAHIEELERINAQLTEAYERELDHRALLRSALSQAEAANVAKNTFLSNMSHDIRTPLNAVVGYAQLIKAHGNDHGRVLTYSDRIRVASEQLLDVVNETLEISRLEAGQMQLAEAECRVSEVMEQVALDCRDTAQRNDVAVQLVVAPLAHDAVITDAVRLSHLLLQLVDNAIKYSHRGDEVRLAVEELPGAPAGYGSYRFVVADHGIGMDPSFLDRMFLPFERESNTTDSGVQGTGLGLTIVRYVLDLLEGSLSVDSTPGEGSTFTVDVRLRLAGDGESAGAPSGHQGLGAVRNILLVEDNELNREIAVCLLEDAGYQVDTAENGRIAVDKIAQRPASSYDLVLMDIQMPVMDGYEATRAIRALSDPLRATLPIIAVSANAFSEDRMRSLESGMNAHLPKPLDVRRLESLMATVVA